MNRLIALGALLLASGCAPRGGGYYDLAQNTGYHCETCVAATQTQLDADRAACGYEMQKVALTAAPGVMLPPTQDFLDSCLSAKGWIRRY